MKCLMIVGASGFIGSAIYNAAQQQGFDLLGTNTKHSVENLYSFDLKDQRISEAVPSALLSKADTAIICATAGSMEACSRNKEGTHLLNVQNTIRLIDDLNANEIKTVFLSTGAVFDGNKGLYTEEDPAEPANEYGRQKRTVEQYLLSQYPSALVLRISKAIDNSSRNDAKNLFAEWFRILKSNGIIHCIDGETFNPTLVADIAQAILKAISQDLCGLYHLANPEIFTRLQLAREFATVFGRHESVESKPMEYFGSCEPRPLNTSLVSSKLISRLRIDFVTVRQVIKDYLEQV